MIKEKPLLPSKPNPVEVDPPLSKKLSLQKELNRLRISMLLIEVVNLPNYKQEIESFKNSQ